MAVGDVVSGLFTGVNTWHSFQPAASVEICITSTLGARDGEMNTAITNGTIYGESRNALNTNFQHTVNTKVMINNTNYLAIKFDGAEGSYAGIQIK